LNSQKKRYDLHTNSEEDEGYVAYYHRFVDFILPYIKSAKTALDFGCGESLILVNIFNNMNMLTTYYDPIYHPSKSYDTKKYDLIASTEVFEHLHEPKKVFSHLINLLNDDGYLAIQTQFHPNNEEAFKKWYYHQDPTHIVFFSPKTFEVLCRQHGCHIVEHNAKNMIVIQKGKTDA
jgi:predicted TPR repeat methyltransferase